MYVRNTNRTALQSQHLIADALIRLMDRRPFEQITVTDICKEAAVGRKTFYRNFELREDVIAFQLDLMVDAYEKEAAGLSYGELMRFHFEYVQKHADFFGVLYQNNLLWMSSQRFLLLQPKMMPVWSDDPVEQAYRSSYITAGIEALQKLWIGRGCRESIDEMLAIIRKTQDKLTPLRE